MTPSETKWTIGSSTIVLEHARARGPTLSLRGSLSAPDAFEALVQLIQEVDRMASARAWPRIVVDLTGLEYASVGLWKALAHWLGLLKPPRTDRYRIALVLHPERAWQSIGRSMLVAFGSGSLES